MNQLLIFDLRLLIENRTKFRAWDLFNQQSEISNQQSLARS